MKRNVDVELQRAKDLIGSRKFKDALKCLDDLAASNASEHKVWAVRAHANAQQGDFQAAHSDWSRAISLHGDEPHYLYMRGIELFKVARYREAVEDFTRVIDLCSRYRSSYYLEPAYFFRADAFARLKEFERARSDCEQIASEVRIWTDQLRTKADILALCGGAS